MQERDAFAFSTDAGDIIDQLDPFAAAAVQCSIQIVHGKTDVMDARTTFGEEFGDRRIALLRLEKLDQGITSAKTGNASTVGVVEGLFGKVEQVAI